MDHQLTSRAREIFDAALETPAAERPAFLDRVCGSDAPLRARVEALLAAIAQAGEFLAAPTVNRTGPGGLQGTTMEVAQADGAESVQGLCDGPGSPLREGPGTRVGR